MSRRSPPQQIEITAAAPAAVVDALRELVRSRSGWVNLFPEVDEDAVAAVTPSAVGAIFRAAGPPIPQATITAPAVGRRGPKRAQLGLTHGVGTRVLPRLKAEGVERPPEWKVVQDHVRRGVVLSLDDPVDEHRAVTWAIQAATLLCPIAVTGRWLAEVHRP